jgi:hypothetical protein
MELYRLSSSSDDGAPLSYRVGVLATPAQESFILKIKDMFVSVFLISFQKIQKLNSPKNEKLRSL